MASVTARFHNIKRSRILPDDSGQELIGVDEDGNEVAVTFPAHALMGVIQAASMALSSINQRLGRGIMCVETEDARAHILNEAGKIGVEMAFGKHGHLYFALPTDVARTLAADIAEKAEQASPPGGQTRSH